MSRTTFEGIRPRLRSPGMEFASELIIEAARANLTFREIDIPCRPRSGARRLRTYKDGWRHLRLLLMYSPSHLFLLPGGISCLLGAMLLASLARGPLKVMGAVFDYHLLILGALLWLVGLQTIFAGLCAKAVSYAYERDIGEAFFNRFLSWFTLERGLLVGVVQLAMGVVMAVSIFLASARTGFSRLAQLRPTVLGLTFTAGGAATIFASFLIGIILMNRSAR